MGLAGWAILSIQLWGSFWWCSCSGSHSYSKKPPTCALLASPSWTAVGFRVTLESYKEEARVYVSPGKESLKHPQVYLASLPSTGRAMRMGARIQLLSWGWVGVTEEAVTQSDHSSLGPSISSSTFQSSCSLATWGEWVGIPPSSSLPGRVAPPRSSEGLHLPGVPSVP